MELIWTRVLCGKLTHFTLLYHLDFVYHIVFIVQPDWTISYGYLTVYSLLNWLCSRVTSLFCVKCLYRYVRVLVLWYDISCVDVVVNCLIHFNRVLFWIISSMNYLDGCYFRKVELMSDSCVVCATLSTSRLIIMLTDNVTIPKTYLWVNLRSL